MDHSSGSPVDVEGSKVRVKAGEHIPHIFGRRGRDRSRRAVIRNAANGSAAGIHQLNKNASCLVVQEPPEWIFFQQYATFPVAWSLDSPLISFHIPINFFCSAAGLVAARASGTREIAVMTALRFIGLSYYQELLSLGRQLL